MANKQQLLKEFEETISSFEEEGFLDSHFTIARTMKENDGPFSFVELLKTFRDDAQTTINILTQALDQHAVDFTLIEEQGIKLKGSSSCLGIPRVAHACGDLMRASSNTSKPECFLALNRIKHEFSVMQEKFDIIVELENKIIPFELESA